MIDATKSQAQQKTVKLSLQTEQQGGHVQGILPTSKEGAERSLRKLAGCLNIFFEKIGQPKKL